MTSKRARVSIPDRAGLQHVRQVVHRTMEEDPWSAAGDVVETTFTKSWTASFEDPDDAQVSVDAPNGPDYWFGAEVKDVDFDIRFRLGVTDEGALVVTGLLLGDPGGTQAITTSNLHRLPIGSLYQAIGALNDATTALTDRARTFKGDVPTRGGQRLPEEQFQQAAEIYKQCLIERPNDAIKCVAERLGVSSATASRRVQRARDLGLLTTKKAPTLAELHRIRGKKVHEVDTLKKEAQRITEEIIQAEAREESIEINALFAQRDHLEMALKKSEMELLEIVGRIDGELKARYDAELDRAYSAEEDDDAEHGEAPER